MELFSLCSCVFLCSGRLVVLLLGSGERGREARRRATFPIQILSAGGSQHKAPAGWSTLLLPELQSRNPPSLYFKLGYGLGDTDYVHLLD